MAEARRAAYLQNINRDELSKASKTIEQWNLAGNDWYEHQPPLPPQNVIKIANEWTATTPQGPRWIKGNSVRYAVRFKNNRGPSALGPATDWIEIDDKAFPVLSGFPVDPLEMATTLMIYRSFKSDESHWVQIAQIPASQKTFKDTVQ